MPYRQIIICHLYFLLLVKYISCINEVTLGKYFLFVVKVHQSYVMIQKDKLHNIKLSAMNIPTLQQMICGQKFMSIIKALDGILIKCHYNYKIKKYKIRIAVTTLLKQMYIISNQELSILSSCKYTKYTLWKHFRNTLCSTCSFSQVHYEWRV